MFDTQKCRLVLLTGALMCAIAFVGRLAAQSTTPSSPDNTPQEFKSIEQRMRERRAQQEAAGTWRDPSAVPVPIPVIPAPSPQPAQTPGPPLSPFEAMLAKIKSRGGPADIDALDAIALEIQRDWSGSPTEYGRLMLAVVRQLSSEFFNDLGMEPAHRWATLAMTTAPTMDWEQQDELASLIARFPPYGRESLLAARRRADLEIQLAYLQRIHSDIDPDWEIEKDRPRLPSPPGDASDTPQVRQYEQALARYKTQADRWVKQQSLHILQRDELERLQRWTDNWYAKPPPNLEELTNILNQHAELVPQATRQRIIKGAIQRWLSAMNITSLEDLHAEYFRVRQGATTRPGQDR